MKRSHLDPERALGERGEGSFIKQVIVYFNMSQNLLITLDFPPVKGGVGNYLFNLCRQFNADELTVLTAAGQQDNQAKASFNLIRQRLLLTTSLIWPKWLVLLWHGYRTVRKIKPQLIWAGQVLPVGTVAYILKRWFKIPYLVFTYGLDLELPLKTGGRKLKLTKKILTQAKKVITISEYTKQLLIKLSVPAENIVVIHPAANIQLAPENTEQITQQLKEKYNLEQKKVILTVGRLVERKGQDQVIKAWPQVLAAVPNAVYVIAGEGDYLQPLKQLVAELNLESSVKFIGEVSSEELASWYQLAELFIMVPRQLANGDVEGFGMVYLEANHFGKPVIASYTGGVPDAVAENISGLLVKDPLNKKEIANKIVLLLQDDNLRQCLGREGREWAKKFTWEQVGQKLKQAI